MRQQLASRGARLGAILIDNVCALLSLVPGGVALMSAANSYGNDGMGGALFLLVVGVVGFLGIQIYLLVQDGQTIGKRGLGIRIVDYNDGSLLGAGRILGMRGVLPGVVASIPYVGWLFALLDALFIFGEERRCIHDYMARSKVVVGDAAQTTAGASGTTRAARTDGPAPAASAPAASASASTQRPETPGQAEPSPARPHSNPSPAVPPSIDRLRQVLQNLEALRDEGAITQEKFERSRRKALADLVEKTDADDDALLRGLRQLRGEGHLTDPDVQTVKSIL